MPNLTNSEHSSRRNVSANRPCRHGHPTGRDVRFGRPPDQPEMISVESRQRDHGELRRTSEGGGRPDHHQHRGDRRKNGQPLATSHVGSAAIHRASCMHTVWIGVPSRAARASSRITCERGTLWLAPGGHNADGREARVARGEVRSQAG
jgi:hypothetical protein